MKTTIEWFESRKTPPLIGKRILFLVKGQICIGTADYNVFLERVWKDDCNCDSDGMPREWRDYEVTHWAVCPEIKTDGAK